MLGMFAFLMAIVVMAFSFFVNPASASEVVFRLDDVQDFYLSAQQEAVMDVFADHEAGLADIVASPRSNTTSSLVLEDDFEPTIDNSQWSDLSDAFVVNGGAKGGKCLFFDGTGSRYITTRSLDVATYDVIFFDFSYGNEGYPPGDPVDETNEEVVLEYSTDNGNSWTLIGRLEKGTQPWFPAVVDIPAGAQGPNTLFRWRQLSHDGKGTDNWFLDDVFIQSKSSCHPVADNFDPTIDSSQWSDISDGFVNDNFGGSNALFFDGSGQRYATTRAVNSLGGETVSFDLIYGNNKNGGEYLDSINEEVVLEYSANGDQWVEVNRLQTRRICGLDSYCRTHPSPS